MAQGTSGYFPYRPALDGVRAVAVLAVVWYHSTSVAIGHPLGSGGFLGVSTFFTLSGFLITSLLLAEGRATGSVDLGAFWGRRLKRLAPAALTVVAAVVVVNELSFGHWGTLTRRQPIAAATNVMNVYIHTDAFDLAHAVGPLSPYWSLAVEEQFYVALTILFLVVRGRAWAPRALMWVFATAFVACPLFGLLVHPVTIRELYLLPARSSELAAGALLALAVGRWGFPRGPAVPWVKVAGWAGLAGTIAVYVWTKGDQRWLYSGGLGLVSLATVGLTLGCLRDDGVARWLALPPLVWIGQLSYSLYLVHWPVIRLLTSTRLHVHGWALVPVQAAAALGVATVLSLLIEQPIRRRWRARPPVIAGAWLAATAAVCALSLLLV